MYLLVQGMHMVPSGSLGSSVHVMQFFLIIKFWILYIFGSALPYYSNDIKQKLQNSSSRLLEIMS